MSGFQDGVSVEIEAPDIETFGSNQSRKIRVQDAPADSGCLARADVDAVLPTSSAAAWEILTHEDNHKIFKSISRAGERKYIRNTKHLQEYDVSHYIGWQFLWRKGEFRTLLRVRQDKRKHTVSFHLLESDIMKKFDGLWTLYPYSQRSVDKIFGKSRGFNPIGSLTDMLASKREHRCIVQFEQNITPKGVPKKLRGLARRIAASAMTQTLSDIDDEAKRIQHGASRIPELNKFAYRPGAPARLAPDREGDSASSEEARAQHGPKQGRRNRQQHAEMAAAPAGSLSAATYQRGAHAAAQRKSRKEREAADASSASTHDAQRVPCSPSRTGLWRASLGNCITV